MIPENFEYSSPSSLAEALALLAGGEKKALAGGMSLIPMMKLRLATPGHVVDLGRIAELNGITEDGGALRIGATTTHYQIESSPLVRARCPLLAETAASIGDVQVRNSGTIGGSLAHADPAADYPAALLVLEAQVRLAGARSDRTLAVEEFLVDTFTTAAEPGEIVREVIVPANAAGAGAAYQKLVQPASGFAIVGIAARVAISAGKIAWARVGVTGLAPNPFRARTVESLLEGTAGASADVSRAAAAIADGVEANRDIHASAAYRRHMARVCAARALAAAISRAR